MKVTLTAMFIWILMQITIGYLEAQDGFRVFPYLQHPAPEAMTILWFSEEQSPGQLLWWEKNSEVVTTVENSLHVAQQVSLLAP